MDNMWITLPIFCVVTGVVLCNEPARIETIDAGERSFQFRRAVDGRRGRNYFNPDGIGYYSRLEAEDTSFDGDEAKSGFSDIRNNVPGEPGTDYPAYTEIPETSFSCAGRAPGYYADVSARCQVFHVCHNVILSSFICPIGSIFDQKLLTCDWWIKVNCSIVTDHYETNEETFEDDRQMVARASVMTKLPESKTMGVTPRDGFPNYTTRKDNFFTNLGRGQSNEFETTNAKQGRRFGAQTPNAKPNTPSFQSTPVINVNVLNRDAPVDTRGQNFPGVARTDSPIIYIEKNLNDKRFNAYSTRLPPIANTFRTSEEQGNTLRNSFQPPYAPTVPTVTTTTRRLYSPTVPTAMRPSTLAYDKLDQVYGSSNHFYTHGRSRQSSLMSTIGYGETASTPGRIYQENSDEVGEKHDHRMESTTFKDDREENQVEEEEEEEENHEGIGFGRRKAAIANVNVEKRLGLRKRNGNRVSQDLENEKITVTTPQSMESLRYELSTGVTDKIIPERNDEDEMNEQQQQHRDEESQEAFGTLNASDAGNLELLRYTKPDSTDDSGTTSVFANSLPTSISALMSDLIEQREESSVTSSSIFTREPVHPLDATETTLKPVSDSDIEIGSGLESKTTTTEPVEFLDNSTSPEFRINVQDLPQPGNYQPFGSNESLEENDTEIARPDPSESLLPPLSFFDNTSDLPSQGAVEPSRVIAEFTTTEIRDVPVNNVPKLILDLVPPENDDFASLLNETNVNSKDSEPDVSNRILYTRTSTSIVPPTSTEEIVTTVATEPEGSSAYGIHLQESSTINDVSSKSTIDHLHLRETTTRNTPSHESSTDLPDLRSMSTNDDHSHSATDDSLPDSTTIWSTIWSDTVTPTAVTPESIETEFSTAKTFSPKFNRLPFRKSIVGNNAKGLRDTVVDSTTIDPLESSGSTSSLNVISQSTADPSSFSSPSPRSIAAFSPKMHSTPFASSNEDPLDRKRIDGFDAEIPDTSDSSFKESTVNFISTTPTQKTFDFTEKSHFSTSTLENVIDARPEISPALRSMVEPADGSENEQPQLPGTTVSQSDLPLNLSEILATTGVLENDESKYVEQNGKTSTVPQMKPTEVTDDSKKQLLQAVHATALQSGLPLSFSQIEESVTNDENAPFEVSFVVKGDEDFVPSSDFINQLLAQHTEANPGSSDFAGFEIVKSTSEHDSDIVGQSPSTFGPTSQPIANTIMNHHREPEIQRRGKNINSNFYNSLETPNPKDSENAKQELNSPELRPTPSFSSTVATAKKPEFRIEVPDDFPTITTTPEIEGTSKDTSTTPLPRIVQPLPETSVPFKVPSKEEILEDFTKHFGHPIYGPNGQQLFNTPNIQRVPDFQAAPNFQQSAENNFTTNQITASTESPTQGTLDVISTQPFVDLRQYKTTAKNNLDTNQKTLISSTENQHPSNLNDDRPFVTLEQYQSARSNSVQNSLTTPTSETNGETAADFVDLQKYRSGEIIEAVRRNPTTSQPSSTTSTTPKPTKTIVQTEFVPALSFSFDTDEDRQEYVKAVLEGLLSNNRSIDPWGSDGRG